MYRDAPGQSFSGGSVASGVMSPTTSWFFAEGATGPFFDTYLLLANPGDTPGIVTVQPATWLSDQIELPATVMDHVEGSQGVFHLWLQFEALNAGLAEAMDRHLFRLHRRQVAEARQFASRT